MHLVSLLVLLLHRTVPKNLRKSRFQQTTCFSSFYMKNYLKGLIASGLAARLLSSRRIKSSSPITFLPIFALPFTSSNHHFGDWRTIAFACSSCTCCRVLCWFCKVLQFRMFLEFGVVQPVAYLYIVCYQ